MPGNSIGRKFVITCFGESHGRCIGVTIDGCPPGLDISENDIQKELEKRRPGYDRITTERIEKDQVEFISGIFRGRTTGAPLTMIVWNEDVNSDAYEELRWKPRPGHADYPALIRYRGYNDYRGAGRFSGRITVSLVMAGALAKKMLSMIGVEVMAYTKEIGGITSKAMTIEEIRKNVYTNPSRCPDFETAEKMKKAIIKIRGDGDSLGGIVECISLNLPVGVGEPIFDSLDSDLAKMLFNIPAVKGVEFGVGFEAAHLLGSENNDQYTIKEGKIVTLSNNSGGILGGLTNGMPICLRVVFKPPPSISKRQQTVDLRNMKNTTIDVKGRHDPCIVPRAVPVVESAVSIVLVDHLLRLNLIDLGE
jgi:chorismate synthase